MDQVSRRGLEDVNRVFVSLLHGNVPSTCRWYRPSGDSATAIILPSLPGPMGTRNTRRSFGSPVPTSGSDPQPRRAGRRGEAVQSNVFHVMPIAPPIATVASTCWAAAGIELRNAGTRNAVHAVAIILWDMRPSLCMQMIRSPICWIASSGNKQIAVSAGSLRLLCRGKRPRFADLRAIGISVAC
jgi:hypothetical protein